MNFISQFYKKIFVKDLRLPDGIKKGYLNLTKIKNIYYFFKIFFNKNNRKITKTKNNYDLKYIF